MKATDILMEEHQLIKRLLKVLDTAVQRLEQGQMLRPEFFLEVADFNLHFTDRRHHRKEEALFTSMVAHGLSAQTSAVALMPQEHRQGLVHNEDLRAMARRWQAGDDAARATIIAAVNEYAATLHQHIHEETHILFPIAKQILPPEAQDELAATFERIEREDIAADAHPNYRALVETLEHEVGLR
ncbi:MAG: hemerythrin domain-containing protein [Candidatus Competibacteraceae bacterium]|nr:hemerythrin domain-containing protein [Candidatus Competibacteraceae bacterium]